MCLKRVYILIVLHEESESMYDVCQVTYNISSSHSRMISLTYVAT